MMLTLTLVAILLADPQPRAEPQKGWAVGIRGYTKYRRMKPPGWNIELRGFTNPRKRARPPNVWLFEWQFAHPKLHVQPVEAQYHHDLSALFKQLEMRCRIEPVESFYVEDLSAVFKCLRKR